MRNYLLIILLLFAGYTANSQVLISLLLGDKLNSEGLEFGLEGGLNLTNIAEFDSPSMLGNFNLGFYFDIRMKEQLYFYTGVQVKSSFGMRDLSQEDLDYLVPDLVPYNAEGKYNQKLNAFMVPMLLNYKFKNHIYLEAGPQLGWVYNSWVEEKFKEDDVDAKIKHYNKDLLNWFNMGGAIGAGYKLKKGEGMTIGMRYYHAFTDVFETRSGTKNNSLHFKVNIPIGAGNKDKKE